MGIEAGLNVFGESVFSCRRFVFSMLRTATQKESSSRKLFLKGVPRGTEHIRCSLIVANADHQGTLHVAIVKF